MKVRSYLPTRFHFINENLAIIEFIAVIQEIAFASAMHRENLRSQKHHGIGLQKKN